MWNNVIGAIEIDTCVFEEDKNKLKEKIERDLKSFKDKMDIYVNVVNGFDTYEDVFYNGETVSYSYQTNVIITFSADIRYCDNEDEGIELVNTLVEELNDKYIIMKGAATVNGKNIIIKDN